MNIHHIAITSTDLGRLKAKLDAVLPDIDLGVHSFNERVMGIKGQSPEILVYRAGREQNNFEFLLGSPGLRRLQIGAAEPATVSSHVASGDLEQSECSEVWRLKNHDNLELVIQQLKGATNTHVTTLDLSVANLLQAKDFYKELLRPLDVELCEATPDSFEIKSLSNCSIRFHQATEELKDRQHVYRAPGFHHLAFQVDSREQVEHTYQTALALNSEILDPPFDYPQYSDGYYAVYFCDLDGMKLEFAHIPTATD
ncbi:MAG: VOC family protein [Bdellovibrionales bacterium]|nr:VOC family protein [Bdellovibrionales bacterium]